MIDVTPKENTVEIPTKKFIIILLLNKLQNKFNHIQRKLVCCLKLTFLVNKRDSVH